MAKVITKELENIKGSKLYYVGIEAKGVTHYINVGEKTYTAVKELLEGETEEITATTNIEKPFPEEPKKKNIK